MILGMSLTSIGGNLVVHSNCWKYLENRGKYLTGSLARPVDHIKLNPHALCPQLHPLRYHRLPLPFPSTLVTWSHYYAGI